MLEAAFIEARRARPVKMAAQATGERGAGKATAHHHDITEGQIIVITIDPVLPYIEPQGLVFCTIPLAR